MHQINKNPWDDDLKIAQSAREDNELKANKYRSAVKKGYHVPSLSHSLRTQLEAGGFTQSDFNELIIPTSSDSWPSVSENSSKPVLRTQEEFALEYSPSSQNISSKIQNNSPINQIKSNYSSLTWRENPLPDFEIITNYAFNGYCGLYIPTHFPRDELNRRLIGLKKHGCTAHNYSSLSTHELQDRFSVWQEDIHEVLTTALNKKICREDLPKHFGYYEWRRINHKDIPQLTN